MGTHWQRSSCNLKAMACFYHAAVTQEGLKKGERYVIVEFMIILIEILLKINEENNFILFYFILFYFIIIKQ